MTPDESLQVLFIPCSPWFSRFRRRQCAGQRSEKGQQTRLAHSICMALYVCMYGCMYAWYCMICMIWMIWMSVCLCVCMSVCVCFAYVSHPKRFHICFHMRCIYAAHALHTRITYVSQSNHVCFILVWYANHIRFTCVLYTHVLHAQKT
jgi:hypothetical protein